ncbi:DALR anticodon-binding domain-containing protein 3 [Drosophila tropicalis]|uniref:DALR anticodon-binding domain-containing protein 3 n=1 Tax=Drosophila tropicalis TaxID=46794 RepID=UPI0035ABC180
MLPNPKGHLTKQIVDFFTQPLDQEENDAKVVQPFQRCGDLVHFQHYSPSVCDVSIMGHRINWEHFCRKNQLKMRWETKGQNEAQAKLLFHEELVQKMLEESNKTWLFPLLSALPMPKQRYALRFQRIPIIRYVLSAIMEQGADYGKHKNSTIVRPVSITLETPDDDDQELRYFRQERLYHILLRLMEYSDWKLVRAGEKDDNKILNMRIQLQRPKKQKDNTVIIVCGPVVEPGKRIATNLTSGSYMALRSTDMILMAIHRNGVRDIGNNKTDAMLMESLGSAAVVVDLFEVRHASAATVVRNSNGCSKGASFVLYNSARLETLLRNFNAQVKAGVYPPLPPLNEIDFSLLEDDLDWQLIYGCLLAFPQVTESTLVQLQKGLCGVHTLVHFISVMAKQFSRYYRNKQVLLQGRDQLTPVLHARVYLIKAVREVLNAALAIMGIKPVNYM